MALETGPVFERLGSMERIYNHELSRNLRCEGIECSVSESGDAIIPELEEAEEIQLAFSKAHARILKDAPLIAEQIQRQRAKDGLIPLHPKTVGFLSRQIANDRNRPPKQAGIEKKITRSHWRHSIDQGSLDLIDRCSKPSRALRLRTVRNENTQSVILPAIVSDLVSEHFPLRNRRNITAIQVMVRCTDKTPDLPAKMILKSALLLCEKISDQAQREKMKAQIKVGLALAGISALDAPLASSKVRVNDPTLTKVLLDRLSPATRRMRLSHEIDRNAERHQEQRRTVPEPVTLNDALTRHFEQRRRYVYSH
jgi:hypothetical protein